MTLKDYMDLIDSANTNEELEKIEYLAFMQDMRATLPGQMIYNTVLKLCAERKKEVCNE